MSVTGACWVCTHTHTTVRKTHCSAITGAILYSNRILVHHQRVILLAEHTNERNVHIVDHIEDTISLSGTFAHMLYTNKSTRLDVTTGIYLHVICLLSAFAPRCGSDSRGQHIRTKFQLLLLSKPEKIPLPSLFCLNHYVSTKLNLFYSIICSYLWQGYAEAASFISSCSHCISHSADPGPLSTPFLLTSPLLPRADLDSCTPRATQCEKADTPPPHLLAHDPLRPQQEPHSFLCGHSFILLHHRGTRNNLRGVLCGEIWAFCSCHDVLIK